MENNQNNEQTPKHTPFLKRVINLEKESSELKDEIAQMKSKIEIIIKSLRR